MPDVMKRNDQAMQRQGEMTQAEQFVRPRAAVYEDGDHVYLELEMPGVGRDNIDITVEKDELTITGWRKPDSYENCEVMHRERIPMNFRRSFVLSDVIDTGKIGASYVDGVLKLTLPKSEGSKPKKITIE